MPIQITVKGGTWYRGEDLLTKEWFQKWGEAIKIMKVKGRKDKVLITKLADISIGRAEDNAIVLDNPSISRKHLRIYQKGLIWKKWYAEDIGSSKGTVLLHEGTETTLKKNIPTALQNNDTLALGQTTFLTVTFE